MYLHSIAAYADQILDALDESSMQRLRALQLNELCVLHHSWGRFIRNDFGLWNADHPLTQHWHAHPEDHDIRNETDYSEDHPDYVSMEIMKAVWRKVNA